MERTMSFPERELHYQHEVKSVKNINIRIRPDMTVYVSSNPQIELSEVEKILAEKKTYIFEALDRYAEMKKYASHEREYVNGESFRFLGRDLRLKVELGEKNIVDTDGLYLFLTIKENIAEVKKRTVEQWFSKMCEQEIGAVCREVYHYFEKYNVTFPLIRFRSMISRWGSCQPKRKVLTFNRRLIEMPKICIEYVVLHEFVHFLQPDHSKRFYSLMTMFMPDWKERAQLLEKEGVFGIEV